MRQIAEEIHTRCYESGVHVPCQSFDGQWHTLVVRSLTGEPLTIFQLQKDVWRSVEKMSKSAILVELKSLNKNVVFMQIEEAGNTSKVNRVATNGGIHLPKWRQLNEKASDRYEPTRESTDEVVTVQEADQLVLEAFASNVNEENWRKELEEINEQQDVEEETDTESELMPDKRTYNTNTQQEHSLTITDMGRVLSLLRTTKDTNKKGRWNDVSEEQLLTYFTSIAHLKKFLDVDLRVIVKYFRKSKGLNGTKEYDNKDRKIKGIASFIGLSVEQLTVEKRVRKVKVKSLKELAAKEVSKYSVFIRCSIA